jgi:23S rRNA pseudouridine955/2504/2580 synthase
MENNRPQVRYVEVCSERAGQRLDNFLINEIKGVPRTLIYRILRKGEVRVNKKRAKQTYRLQEGDSVRIPPVRVAVSTQEERWVSDSLSQRLKSSVIYEDETLLIVNKPSGLAVHGGSGVSLGLIEAMRLVFPDYRHLELVHRLDRDTSGCLMLSKKRSALKYLHQQLREGHVTKRYQCLVQGRWPKRLVQVDAPLRKYERASGERVVRVSEDGKRSRTLFKVLDLYQGATLLEAQPVTGRTHQIRVHTQCSGHPIACDPKYGAQAFDGFCRERGLERLFLHAASLTLIPPGAEHPITVEAPLDDALQATLSRLEKQ